MAEQKHATRLPLPDNFALQRVFGTPPFSCLDGWIDGSMDTLLICVITTGLTPCALMSKERHYDNTASLSYEL